MEPPQGQCLLLARQLQLTTILPASECVQLAQRLFACQHPQNDPAIVSLSESGVYSDLEVTCTELGIMIEAMETQESVITG